jgi:hypothetical protein
MALAGAGLYAAFGHGGGGSGGGGRSPSGGAAGRPAAQAPGQPFPDAPQSQHFSTFGRCPVAPPSRYLPDRVGCLSVRRADVDGDRRPDLVLLYAHLDSRGYPLFRHDHAGAFTLKLVRASGGSLATRVPQGDLNSTILRARDINARTGIELLVHEYHVTTEEELGVYAFDGVGLRRAGGFRFDGTDGGIVFGVTCHPRPATIVQHDFAERIPFRSVWDRTDTTYRWVGAHLRRTTVRKAKARPTRRQIGDHC